LQVETEFVVRHCWRCVFEHQISINGKFNMNLLKQPTQGTQCMKIAQVCGYAEDLWLSFLYQI